MTPEQIEAHKKEYFEPDENGHSRCLYCGTIEMAHDVVHRGDCPLSEARARIEEQGSREKLI